jgi:hypothetical protein
VPATKDRLPVEVLYARNERKPDFEEEDDR